jgi:hypothetical protein
MQCPSSINRSIPKKLSATDRKVCWTYSSTAADEAWVLRNVILNPVPYFLQFQKLNYSTFHTHSITQHVATSVHPNLTGYSRVSKDLQQDQ